ncbi:MAG: single-stranded-DNA-specific exonuclease RecJ [Bacteroidetes bacterium]|nr:MAG: single-stranded-DNA-specific exonuclease RecJ [Bacteroidota bacterium]
MQKNWRAKPIPTPEVVNHLKSVLGIGDILAILLAQRGIQTFDEAKHFFRPDKSFLHDPFLMPDMQAAVNRIEVALKKGEKVLLFGDYDVDGTTSVSLMYLFLKPHHDQLEFYIPDRFLEGYGISQAGIDYAANEGFSLVISLDCGVKSVELIAQAKERGIDFIVCDHHEPGEVLPPAIAVLDAKRKDSNYPYTELSGCGVGFKLAQALTQYFVWPEDDLWALMDFVAVSIACDIVQMDGENRALSYLGMQKLNANPHPGIKVLLKKAFEKNPKKVYDISDVLFYAGPRINAAGRLYHAKGAVELLIEQSEDKAWEFAQALHLHNEQRRNLEQEISKQAESELEAMPDFAKSKSTVAYNPEWNKGVIGIVASRLVEKYYRPTIVLTRSEGKLAGSARSVGNFDIHSAIEACSEHLLQFGGHTHAAGLTLKEENLVAFKAAFEKVVTERIHPDDLQPSLEYDLEIPLNLIHDKWVDKLMQMNPFGPGNMNPIFMSRKVRDTGMPKAYGEHLSLNLWAGEQVIGAMAFSQAVNLNAVKQGKLFDICYHIDRSEFNGKTRLQLRILDMKPSE